MNKTDVLALLEDNQNERGIQNWKKLGTQAGGLRSFGIGLTQLRKLAKKIGRNHELALELWESNVYDAKVVALLIDDPKVITREQAEMQVERLGRAAWRMCFPPAMRRWPRPHSWASSQTAGWTAMIPSRRDCGYGLLYEISKSKKKSAPDDDYFLGHIQHIDSSFDDEELSVQTAMGGALVGIGKRNVKLNAAALKVARRIGPIDFDEDGKCDPFDPVKHLTSDYLRKKFGG